MADGRPSTAARPRWSRVLRALREARGVTQEGWAALLRVGVNTVGRWESGTAVPNAAAEQEIIAVCRERGLFRAYTEGPLRDLTLTPDLLADLLAEARLHAGPGRPGDPMAPPSAEAEDVNRVAPGGLGTPGAHAGHHLPIPPTPLIGRDEDRARLLSRLKDPACRLVTLTGMGGIGKTRLALQAASDLLPEHDAASPFVHGVAFVPLTAVIAPEPLDDLLATAVASALDFALSGRGAPTVEIVQYLREKSLLLVLDDVEHLPAGPFLASLLQEAPALKILATSRGRLNVRGEWVVDLPSLGVPADDDPDFGPDLMRFSAIELFVRMAQTLAPDFALSTETGPAVRRICRLVAGLPLGIELAASWIRMLTCDEIADEIERSIDFLSANLQDVPERHRSLRAVFATSWERLGSEEQQALRQLAIFLGSFTREPAAAVAGATLPRLAALVDRSLVRPHPTGRAGPGGHVRYELLAPVRQYAAEHLAQAGEASEGRSPLSGNRSGPGHHIAHGDSDPELRSGFPLPTGSIHGDPVSLPSPCFPHVPLVTAEFR
jgi:predicted ATPase/transcriptional regulator with XRE-family HTH domain